MSSKRERTDFNDLLEAGVHFGHLKRRWNPKMAPYIFMERNGIHIIDLHKTLLKLDEAAEAIKQIAKSGRRILFVGTKPQAQGIIAEYVEKIDMPYVTERWPGGMLTNFPTIRKAVKKMSTIDKMNEDGTFDNFSKRERLQISRQREKLERNLGSIADLTRLPAAIFVVDVEKEQNAVREANRLNIPVFAMVDTCCDPTNIDFVIPANDDAEESITKIVAIMVEAVAEGLNERKMERAKGDEEGKESKGRQQRGGRRARTSADKKAVKVEVESIKKATEKAEEAKKTEAKKAKAEAKAEPKKEAKKEAKEEK